MMNNLKDKTIGQLKEGKVKIFDLRKQTLFLFYASIIS